MCVSDRFYCDPVAKLQRTHSSRNQNLFFFNSKNKNIRLKPLQVEIVIVYNPEGFHKIKNSGEYLNLYAFLTCM